MLQGKRILIVEEQFLIALDIQRILEGAHATQMVFARTTSEAQALTDRLAEFDLAIVQVSRGDRAALTLASRLRSAGAAVVVTTASPEFRYAELAPGPDAVLVKPFGDDDLVSASLNALAVKTRECRTAAADAEASAGPGSHQV